MSTRQLVNALEANLARVIVGKPRVIRLSLLPLLCQGHLLIEDVPGVGKTTLARALARSIQGEFKRIQFTPDLLPLDLTGSSIFNQQTSAFEFHTGPVFTNVLLADEINRATPRTQSALLESMEERQVTVDGVTRPLPDVFLVIATQNPVEQVGTFELPETQLDRFLLRIHMGYPTQEDEVAIFDRQADGHPLSKLKPAASLEQIMELRAAVRDVHISEGIKTYAVQLVRETRQHPDVALGASPRGTLALLRAAQAWALLEERTFAQPDDVKALAVNVLGHRVLTRPQAALRGRTGEDVVRELLDRVPVPVTDAQTSASGRSRPIGSNVTHPTRGEKGASGSLISRPSR